jgi:hypothetical protein
MQSSGRTRERNETDRGEEETQTGHGNADPPDGVNGDWTV